MSYPEEKPELIKELYGRTLEKNRALLIYLGYSGALLRVRDFVLAFDVSDLLRPSEINELKRLDMLAFTHSHYDHYQRKTTIDIQNKTGTYVLAEPQVCRDLIKKIPEEKLVCIKPGESKKLNGIEITAISGIHVGPIISIS